MFCVDCYCGSIKCVTSEGRVEKDDRDITRMCVRLIFVYRTAVHSQSVGKTDVRFGQILNIVSSLCVSCLI